MWKNNDFFIEFVSNETELKEKSTSSSSYKALIIFKSKKILDEQTESSFVLNGETPKLKEKETSYIDKLIVEEKVQFEKIKLDNLVEELTPKLMTELKYFSSDDSEITSAEKLALDIEKSYSMRVLGEVLQNIYIQYNDYYNMLIGICKILGRFELKEVMPWGPTMLMGLLSHKNETVKEYAVAVVENWAEVDLLPVLRNLDCSSHWLKEYIEDVVKYLEGCYVLHKKIV